MARRVTGRAGSGRPGATEAEPSRGDCLMVSGVYGGAVTYPPGATFGPRVMMDFEAVWIVSGDVVYGTAEHEFDAGAGSIVLARPGFRDRFVWDRDRPTRHAYFHFTAERLPRDWPPVVAWPVMKVMPGHDIVRPLFRYVLAQLREGGAGDAGRKRGSRITENTRRAIEMLLGAYLLGPLGQAAEHDVAYPEAVRRAMMLVTALNRETPVGAVTLADLSKAGSVSPEHLCRLFRQTFDASPMEAVRLSRLDLSLGLMARSNLRLKEIAHRCGFASAFHFSRRFKEAYGVSPSLMRQQIARGEAPPASRLMRK